MHGEFNFLVAPLFALNIAKHNLLKLRYNLSIKVCDEFCGRLKQTLADIKEVSAG